MYFLRRFLYIFPTLLGILLVNFCIVHMAPGGPWDYALARMEDEGVVGDSASMPVGAVSSAHRADDDIVKKLKAQFHFDEPLWRRFWVMLKQYCLFDLGKSYFKGTSVMGLIGQRLCVSLSLGLWSACLIYCVSVPLGIAKAVRHGTRFDVWTSVMVMICYAVPSFLFALTLLVLFAGGSFLTWFPLRGLVSSDWAQLSFWGQIKDYAWHLCLPVLSQFLGGFSSLVLLTKNSFLEEISKAYVLTARASGWSERAVLLRFVFRNAMLVIVAGLPMVLMGVLLGGAILVETVFSLDGMGLLAYEAVNSRDYPVIFGVLYLFSLLGLLAHLASDWLYTVIDPRINYRGVQS